MKLGELRAAIRATKGNVLIDASVGASPSMRFAVQKTSFLEALEGAYPGGKNVETGLSFDPDTLLVAGEGLIGVMTAPVERRETIAERPAAAVTILDL
jgi:hypothetical protein